MTFTLIAPTTNLYGPWLDCHREWGPGRHEDGFGLLPTDDVDSARGFGDWVERLHADQSTIYRWIAEEDRISGGIALRHSDSDATSLAGHIGFGIRPSARRHGLAVTAVRQMLPLARARGLDRVILVCAAENTASASTIERAGGVLEKVVDTPLGTARRYWLTTAVPSG